MKNRGKHTGLVNPRFYVIDKKYKKVDERDNTVEMVKKRSEKFAPKPADIISKLQLTYKPSATYSFKNT